MTGIDKTQKAVHIHNEVAAKLGCVVTVRVVEGSVLEPTFDVDPQNARMP